MSKSLSLLDRNSKIVCTFASLNKEFDMQMFYTPDIQTNLELPSDEAQHCVRVLRLTEGEEILLTDGKGCFYKAIITQAHQKHCFVELTETIAQPTIWDFKLHIAVAPTKNMDRMEWFVEKATEIGIDAITCLSTRFSERKEIKTARLDKILVSAMKQSQKATLPQLTGMTPFKTLVNTPFDGRKFIAHCNVGEALGEKLLIKERYNKGEDVLILIGPEGDFSPEEVALALAQGFEPISLGNSRLRTETAALVACHTVHVLNQ